MDRVGQEMILRGLLIGLTLVTISAAQKQNKTGGLMVLVPDANLQLKEVSVDTLRFQASALAGAETEVVITVYTRRNPIEGQTITTGDVDSIRRSNYNPANPSRFLIHGYLHSANELQNQNLRNKYLQVGDYNIFFVDWFVGAATVNYAAAIVNTKEAGKQIAAFIDFMNAKGGMSFDTVYLLGHSLGSHVAGHTGKNTKNGIVNTIIGLDPAFPLYTIDDTSARLNRGDARYVEIIHTGIGGMGFDFPIGNASFYPNYGNRQPGCEGPLLEICDHHRVFDIYQESLGPGTNEFYAKECASYDDILARTCPATGVIAQMGGDPSNYDKGVSGVFYLPTNAREPFAMGRSWF